MRAHAIGLICFTVFLAAAGAALAQGKAAADPITGTWIGDWGPSPGDRNAVSVDLKWDGKALTGTVKSQGASPVQLQKATYDAKTGAVHMEVDAKARQGAIHYVIDGKVEKGVMSGTWNHDNRKGDFKITKQ